MTKQLTLKLNTMGENITMQDFVDGNAALDLVRGVRVEVYNTGNRGQFLIALYDRTDRRGPIQGSWVNGEFESMRKMRDIQRKYGKEYANNN